MQETKYYDQDGIEQSMIETFTAAHVDARMARDKLFQKMNNRLFQLEEVGHTLVQQKPITLSEKLVIERAKKAKKKLNRMNKEIA